MEQPSLWKQAKAFIWKLRYTIQFCKRMRSYHWSAIHFGWRNAGHIIKGTKPLPASPEESADEGIIIIKGKHQ